MKYLPFSQVTDINVGRLLRENGINNPDQTAEAIKYLYWSHGNPITVQLGSTKIEFTNRGMKLTKGV